MSLARKLSSLLESESTLRTLKLAVGLISIATVFSLLQYATDSICCGDFDGYYHIMWSRMLWEGIRARHMPQFAALPLTTLNPKDYVDHHLLFHVFQIPFTWFRDLRQGAKIASVIFAVLAVFSCYWLMVRYQIRYVLVWLVALLACSTPFLFRLNMAKAPPFAIIYLVIGIYLLFEKKYWLLAPLSFVFTLTYDMFVLLIAAAAIWTLVIGWTEHRFEWRPLVFTLSGAAAGFVINPYFPHNLALFFEHLKIKLTMGAFSTKVGQEWYPYSSWEFLGNSVVACIATAIGYIAFDPADRKRSHHTLFFLLLSTLLMVMNMRWQRIAEYWPPFAILFAAFALQPWVEGVRSNLTRLSSDMLDELQPFLDLQEPAARKDNREMWQLGGAALVTVILGIPLMANLMVARRDIAKSEYGDFYKAGIQWLRSNVPANELVFNTDWDDFPRLYYFDPTHRYVSGLDPTYLYDKNPELSKLYDRITLGKQSDPGPLIRDRFGARYVFTDNENIHSDFYNNAMDSGWFEIVYEDEECMILHIRDQKLEPTPEENPEETPADDTNDEDPTNQ
ncbi:MAG TPA: hypothetical protein VN643_13655 [Pyrinomonadaceae bacterium]|nr:hypothetical protein [Pyrinomonadaceae bacterium]